MTKAKKGVLDYAMCWHHERERELSRDGSHYSLSNTILHSLGAWSTRRMKLWRFIISPHNQRYNVDELRKLLTDKDAYNSFFHSLEQVKLQNYLRNELQKETLHLARENLDKEPRIFELQNQCQIIRATELAAAQEKLSELEKQMEETLKFYSPPMLMQKLQDAINKVEEESDMLYRQLLENQIDLSTFVQRYKKLRAIYHRRALIHLAARTSAF